MSAALALVFFSAVLAQPQEPKPFRAVRLMPYDKAVPGEILNIQIEGLTEDSPVTVLRPEDFQVVISQDGQDRQAKARTAIASMSRELSAEQIKANVSVNEVPMRQFQNVSFVVPQGLRVGDAEVTVEYRGRQARPIRLTIVERPLPPRLGSVAITSLGPSANIPRQTTGGPGWRLERGTTVQVPVTPLVDPSDSSAAILVRFKQNGTVFEAITRVVNQARKVESGERSIRFSNARDWLEVEVPNSLMQGEAEVEVQIRANGQTSDAVNAKVSITDATRVAEAPAKSAPRLMAVSPKRVGAGQPVMISVDHVRTLEPDPSAAVVVFEKDGVQYSVKPEMNSAVFRRTEDPNAPVLLIARPTRQLIGEAQVRVVNSLRGDVGGTSDPVALEVVDEVFPPELISVGEAGPGELGRLQDMSNQARSAGRPFPEYDPTRRYITIKAKNLDPNPKFLRITLEQQGKKETLSFREFSLSTGDALTVRLPKGFQRGALVVTIENQGVDTFSPAVSKTIELTEPS